VETGAGLLTSRGSRGRGSGREDMAKERERERRIARYGPAAKGSSEAALPLIAVPSRTSSKEAMPRPSGVVPVAVADSGCRGDESVERVVR
jgi:hypothetical protein